MVNENHLYVAIGEAPFDAPLQRMSLDERHTRRTNGGLDTGREPLHSIIH